MGLHAPSLTADVYHLEIVDRCQNHAVYQTPVLEGTALHQVPVSLVRLLGVCETCLHRLEALETSDLLRRPSDDHDWNPVSEDEESLVRIPAQVHLSHNKHINTWFFRFSLTPRKSTHKAPPQPGACNARISAHRPPAETASGQIQTNE